MEAYGDIILHGQFSKNDHLDFTVYEMKSPQDYTNDTFDVVEVNPNVYVTTAQVTSPFVHSTSSWSRDASCEKDTSKFKSPQSHHKGLGEKVNLQITKSDSAYEYLVKSIDKQPYIRFLLSGKYQFQFDFSSIQKETQSIQYNLYN